jgi:phosphate:Na+ symporter
MQFGIPAVALTEAHRELIRLGQVTGQMIERSRQALIDGDMEAARWVVQQEREFVDPVTLSLEGFVNALMRENLSVKQQRRCFQLRNLLTDIERGGDLAEDLAEAAQKRFNGPIAFSSAAIHDLDRLCRHASRTYSLALRALQAGDRALAQQACRLEDEFDHLYIEARQGHIERLEAGICHPEADVIFTETLRNLERIGDHADNLGVSTMRA